MKCYTYKLTLIPDPRYYYFGVRNIYRKAPEFDGYFGSGNGLKSFRKLYGKDCFKKEILKIFLDREECLQEEQRLVGSLWSSDPFCINRMPGGAFDGNFDLTGKKVVSKAGEIRYVNISDLQQFLDQGWVPGLPQDAKQKLLGRICIFKGDRERNIFKDELKEYLSKGWQRGRSPKALNHLCRIHITNGESDRNVRTEEELKYWKAKGWYRGHSKRHIQHSTEAQRGMVWMSKGEELTRVRTEDINIYEESGWSLGHFRNRGKPRPEELKKKISEDQKGRVWINDGVQCKHVWPIEVESWKEKGWQRGRLKGQAPNTSGFLRIFRGSERKAIRAEELEKYLKDGWKKGRGW